MAAAAQLTDMLMFEDQLPDRYVKPGMLPLARQPAAHCSTTRIKSVVLEPGIRMPPYRLQ